MKRDALGGLIWFIATVALVAFMLSTSGPDPLRVFATLGYAGVMFLCSRIVGVD